MEAPAKRVLTQDKHESILASNAPRHDFIPADLTAQLQSVGSRVRKSIADGYSTPSASPLSQSPVKPPHTTPVVGSFIPSANQIYHQVYANGVATPSPSPSPRKRAHPFETPKERERDADAMDCSDDSVSDSSDDDDEDVVIVPHVVGDGFPNALGGSRPVRPMRRPRIAQPVFSNGPVQAGATQPTSSSTVASGDIAMDYLPAIHHRVALTVGGSSGACDEFGGQV